MPYGGVSSDLRWSIIRGKKVYRCPKCHRPLHIKGGDLHCAHCGHVEHVEYGDPEELQ